MKLAEPPRIAAMEKASLADIKEGSFIGVSAMPQPDGTQKAYAIHIFMDSQKGVVADRFGPMGQPAGQHHDQRQRGDHGGRQGWPGPAGQIQGRREEGASCRPARRSRKYAPGSAADLKVGAKVFVAAAKKEADGSLTAPNIAVGRDIDPPQ